eukprot:TRINITY_DN22599_c0_g1_i1.p1 TRINITY_DN22599_c0_g1~~TRINITY_DN22599_c0_g1_i1.p1  ORF type:complete len:292 (+),score=96.18 TRINITY_DN22599_c0_g1_i1:135-1010(+)
MDGDGESGKRTRPGWYKAKTSRKNATKGQKRALRELYPRWGAQLAYREAVGAGWLAGLYGNARPVVLDIGFGCGEALVAMARAHPEKNYLGLDWHTPGVGKALLEIEKAQVENVRVMAVDAVTFLRHNVQGRQRIFGGVQIFFPDPWDRDPRQAAYRLVRRETVALLAAATVPGAPLHLATDIADYVAPSQALLRDAGWVPAGGSDNGVIPRPAWRPVTPYELKGEREGRAPNDLIFESPAELPAWVCEEVARPVRPDPALQPAAGSDARNDDDGDDNGDRAGGCILFDEE